MRTRHHIVHTSKQVKLESAAPVKSSGRQLCFYLPAVLDRSKPHTESVKRRETELSNLLVLELPFSLYRYSLSSLTFTEVN